MYIRRALKTINVGDTVVAVGNQVACNMFLAVEVLGSMHYIVAAGGRNHRVGHILPGVVADTH